MTVLFGRRIEVQVGEPGEEAVSYVAENGRGLRMAFDIQFKRDGKPNTGKVVIYNAGKDIFGRAQSRTAQVRVLAGYTSEGPSRMIFAGNPIPKVGVEYPREGGERVLRINALDSLVKLSRQIVTVEFAGPTTPRQYLDSVAAQTGLAVASAPDALDRAEFSSVSFSGLAPKALAEISSYVDCDYHVMDGAIYILEKGQSGGEEANVFSTKTRNLLSLKANKDGLVEFVGFLDGTVRPGKRVPLEHPDFNGVVVARDVRFVGDNWGNDFYVQVTGKPERTA